MRDAASQRDWRKSNPESAKQSNKKWREANLEKSKAAQLSWRSRNLERARASSRAWNAANPDRMKAAGDRMRFRKYGITRADFEQLLVEQGRRCAGCGSYDHGGKDWQVDHDHATLVVRGILCFGCNSALGFARDNPQTLRNLADYVESKEWG